MKFLIISESTSILEKAGFQKDDRVVVNTNTAKEPTYFIGTVTRVAKADKTVSVLLDNGMKVSSGITNADKGIVGYVSHKRKRKTQIDAKTVMTHIDAAKWYAKKLSSIMDGEREHTPATPDAAPSPQSKPKPVRNDTITFDPASALAFLRSAKSSKSNIVKRATDIASAQIAIVELNADLEKLKEAAKVAKKAAKSPVAAQKVMASKYIAESRIKDALKAVRSAMKGMRSGTSLKGSAKGNVKSRASEIGPHSKGLFFELNDDTSFPKISNKGVNFQTFGFWRPTPSKGATPFPVAMKVPGYSKTDFVKRLKAKEARASKWPERGFSPNRWDGTKNGIQTYYSASAKLLWPEGTMTYLKAGVPPSRAFYKFVMGKELAALPY